MQSSQEKKAFTLHPSIIKSIIMEQAGSLSKAIIELVMNGVDAGATRIDINYKATEHPSLHDEQDDLVISEITIKDDGRGFTSEEQLNFFQQFGAPHDENDAHYGQFRVGRGQIMSYGRCTWRSHIYKMDTDINPNEANTDLGYSLTTYPNKQVQEGCIVTCNLYEPCTPYRSLDLITQITESLLFVPIPIYLNSKQINFSLDDIAWDAEDEYAYYLYDSKILESLARTTCSLARMEYFNKGVLAYTDYNSGGLSGVIVTKQRLAVNMARNTVLFNQCRVWPHIQTQVKGELSRQLSAAKNLNTRQIDHIFNGVLHGTLVLTPVLKAALKKAKIIKTVSNDFISLATFLEYKNFTCFEKGKDNRLMIAESIAEESNLFVITEQTFGDGIYVSLMNARRSTKDELRLSDYIMRFLVKLNQYFPFESENFEMINFNYLAKDKKGLYKIYSEDEEQDKLTSEEYLLLTTIRKYNKEIQPFMSRKVRKIHVGESDTCWAWTNSVSYICLHKKALAFGRKDNFMRLYNLLTHEYCHDDLSSSDTHAHSPEFYKHYHQATMRSDADGIIHRMRTAYLKGLAELQVYPTSNLGLRLDQHAAAVAGIRRKRRKV